MELSSNSMKHLVLAMIMSTPTVALAQTPGPATPAPSSNQGSAESSNSVAVQISGGHETDPRDKGRPVALIAAALGVPDDVFREAFTHVRPAAAGTQPEPDQVRKNKQALMAALAPLGVTDERLNEVSNYYRYRGWAGELWKHKPASATATITNGTVTAVTIIDAGSGYSSPPEVSIPSLPQVHLKATLSFGTDLTTNGAVKEIAVATDVPVATAKP
jgi:hypothetical protein